MKKILKYIFNTLLFVSSLALVSCSNILQDEEQKSSNKITLTANIDFGDNSRKITPMDYSLYNRLKYELVATCNTNNDYSTKGNFTSSTIEMELIAANWSFELTAYDAANTPILRSSENKNIDVTKDTVLNFKMVGVTNGLLEYKFGINCEGEEVLPEDNPVYVFEIYRYIGSIQQTIKPENKLDLSDKNYSYSNKLDITPNGSAAAGNGEPYIWCERKVSIYIPEGTYFVICKKAERSEVDPIVNEETVSEDDLTFLFQELVEIKAGLTTFEYYSPLDSNVITFHTNGGSYVGDYSVATVEENSEYICQYYSGLGGEKLIPVPKKDGYNFLGWYYDEACTKIAETRAGDAINVSFNTKLRGDIDLYAKWCKAEPLPILESASDDKTFSYGIEYGSGDAIEGVVDYAYGENGYIYLIQEVDGGYYDLIKYNVASSTSTTLHSFENENDFDYFNLCKIAYDPVQKIIYLALVNGKLKFIKFDVTTNQPTVWKTFCLSSDLTVIASEEMANKLDLTSINAMAAYNGKIWLSSKDNDAQDKYTIISCFTFNDELELSFASKVSDFVEPIKPAAFPTNPTNFDLTYTKNGSVKSYATITDLAFDSNGKLYGTLAYFTIEKVEEVLPTFFSFGTLISIENNSPKVLFGNTYVRYEDDLCTSEDNNPKSGYFYGISSPRDLKHLAYPTRILAVTPKKLILSDEGVYVWKHPDTGKSGSSDLNRIVEFQLGSTLLEYAFPVDSFLSLSENYFFNGSNFGNDETYFTTNTLSNLF